MAKLLAPAHFLNQPEAALNQVLTGKFRRFGQHCA
jgi:hypothetical protein